MGSLYGYSLIHFDPFPRHHTLSVREDNLDIDQRFAAKPEVRDGRVAGGIAGCGAELMASEQRTGIAGLAGRINSDPRADSIAVDAFRTFKLYLEPVAARRFIMQEQRARFRPPAWQEKSSLPSLS